VHCTSLPRNQGSNKKLTLRAWGVIDVLEYLDEIESDLSAFHRIDDYLEMDCLKFFRLAFRLVHYQGAVRAQAEATSEEEGYSNEYPTQHGSVTTGPVYSDVKAVAGQKSESQARREGLPWIEYG
jgi:hypothetical protein